MAHRFGEAFPKLNDLIVIPWYNKQFQCTTKQYELLTLLLEKRMNTHELMDHLNRFYETSAEDADFILYNDEGAVVQQLDEAAAMYMNTGLTTPEGYPIWVTSERNRRDGAYFFGRDVIRQCPVSVRAHRLLDKYFSADQLIWYAPNYLQENLRKAGVQTLNMNAAIALIEDSWRRATDEQLQTTVQGMAWPELSEADKITFPLNYKATGTRVNVVCTRSEPGRDREWVCRFYSDAAASGAGMPSGFSHLLGTDNSAMVFAPAAAIQLMNGRLVEMAQIDDPAHHCEVDLEEHFRENPVETIRYFDERRRPCGEEQAKYMHFCTGMYKADTADEIILVVGRNPNRDRQPWTMSSRGSWTITTTSDPYPGVSQKNYLFEFSNLSANSPEYMNILKQLSEMAVPETWDFRNEGGLYILDNYIRYTFARQYKRSDNFVPNSKTIVYNSLRTLAAVNTGLADRDTGDEIYMMFHKYQADSNAPWQFEKLCTSEDRMANDELTTHLTHPVYWKDISELVYAYNYDRPAKQQVPKYHVNHLMKRLHRFPRTFLRTVASNLRDDGKRAEAMALLERPGFGEQEGKLLTSFLEGDAHAKKVMKALIDSAIETALGRQQGNYKYIIPTFYPETERMCFLMPLDLNNSGQPDLALVLSKGETGYFGSTVLTMDMAYIDSRLICKPETDWLKPESIGKSNIQEYDV